jgi:hypothetical protein
VTNLMMVVLTNGREDVFSTVPGALGQLKGDFNLKLVVDDSGDDDFHERLHAELGSEFRITRSGFTNMGFTYAMGKVLEHVAAFAPDYVWLHEEDFFIERDVDLERMAAVIEKRSLLQVALLRNPWWHNEVDLGGVIEAREAQAAEFHGCFDGVSSWIEHRDHWSNGPNLFPGHIARHGWPQVAWSESAWGGFLREFYPTSSFAYWGEREVWTTHVGERTGHGY